MFNQSLFFLTYEQILAESVRVGEFRKAAMIATVTGLLAELFTVLDTLRYAWGYLMRYPCLSLLNSQATTAPISMVAGR